jgi:glycosyltransferase involved in cell wall biosynthesis
VAHDPSQGRTAATIPGRTWRIPRKPKTAGLSRLLRIESIKHGRRIRAILGEAAAGADLLHLHSNGLIIEVAAAWAAARRIPYVLTLYGTEIWHFRRRRPVDPFARAFERARTVTFYSHKLLERSSELGLEHDDALVVYPPISRSFEPRDDATRQAWRAALGIAESKVALNVKRLHELAGQQFLIDAFARVARERRDVRLVICGTGPLRQALEARAQDRGVADRVTFTGLIDNDIVSKYAAVADVFALPSLLEALPTVAVEALASGTPVVSADHPGGVELHEMFGDDVRVVPKGNADRLSEALADVLDRPRRVRASTLERVQREFGMDAVMSAYDDIYRRATLE